MQTNANKRAQRQISGPQRRGPQRRQTRTNADNKRNITELHPLRRQPNKDTSQPKTLQNRSVLLGNNQEFLSQNQFQTCGGALTTLYRTLVVHVRACSGEQLSTPSSDVGHQRLFIDATCRGGQSVVASTRNK